MNASHNTLEILTTDQLAELLTVSPRTIKDWRTKDVGPKSRSLNGKQVRYSKEDVMAWLRGL